MWRALLKALKLSDFQPIFTLLLLANHNNTKVNELSKDLYILGAGGAGREIFDLLPDLHEIKSGKWKLAGFLDDKEYSQESLASPVLGSITEWVTSEDQVFVCSIGNPASRAIVTKSITDRGGNFVSLLHPSSRISPSATIGNGTVIFPFAYVSSSSRIGEHVMINIHSAVGHDAAVGNNSVLSSFCDVTGEVSLGERVFLGSHVAIAPGLTIGDDAMIQIGSVVVNNVKQGRKVFGNPAKNWEIK